MKKKLSPLDEAVERLLKTESDEKEDLVQGMHAAKLAKQIRLLMPEFEFLAGVRIGRHARKEERNKQAKFDQACCELSEQLHREGMTLTQAYVKVGRMVNAQPDTVRKARDRAKRASKHSILGTKGTQF